MSRRGRAVFFRASGPPRRARRRAGRTERGSSRRRRGASRSSSRRSRRRRSRCCCLRRIGVERLGESVGAGVVDRGEAGRSVTASAVITSTIAMGEEHARRTILISRASIFFPRYSGVLRPSARRRRPRGGREEHAVEAGADAAEDHLADEHVHDGDSSAAGGQRVVRRRSPSRSRRRSSRSPRGRCSRCRTEPPYRPGCPRSSRPRSRGHPESRSTCDPCCSDGRAIATPMRTSRTWPRRSPSPALQSRPSVRT